jgi:tRNA pseudouridine55 synthase
MTSHDVVAKVRRALKTRRVGHTGTLDPFATGLLVVLVGRGTRLIPYIDDAPKVYDATIAFGSETTTDDLTGDIVRESNHLPSDVEIAEGIARLTGEIDQLPPAFSAKQVDGVRAYDAARRGTPLELAASRVNVHAWTVLTREGTVLRARITCGGGTYIRSLARDLGRLVGSAAHLSALRRVQSGPFDVARAMTIDEIAEGRATILSLLVAVPSFPVQAIAGADLGRVLHGNAIPASDSTAIDDGARVALIDNEQNLIAIAARTGATLQPKLVLRDA